MRRILIAITALSGCLALVPGPSRASGWTPGFTAADTTPATIRGLVFDSTVALPLQGATVAILGSPDSTLMTETDETGQFELPGVPPGEHWLSFFHPRLQVLGVSPVAQLVNLSEGEVSQVVLAVPSMETALAGWCALEPSMGGGTLDIGGVVMDSLTGVTLPSTRVVLTEIGLDGNLQRGRTLTDTTDAAGRFAFCNLPSRAEVRLRAEFGGNQGDLVSLPLANREGAVIQDIRLVLTQPVSIAGLVKDAESGSPLQGAQITVVGANKVGVTDGEGRFSVTQVPPGRHTLVTEYLGYRSRMDSLTVFNNESVGLEIELSTQPIALAPLTVTARSRGGPLGEVRSMGTRFDGLTRTQVDYILPRSRDMASLLRNAQMPSLNIREVSYNTGMGYQWGLCIEATRRSNTNPEACNMVTVYVNGAEYPAADLILQDMDPNTVDSFQFIPAIEAMALYGEKGRYGVLLINLR
jgi:hypothetical protein